MSGSPLCFFLFCFENSKLASYDGSALDVGLDKCSVGRNALAFGELFDLGENEGSVVFAGDVGGIGLS